MHYSFVTPTGIPVPRRKRAFDPATALDGLAEALDGRRGALFSFGIDYPGRYSRWEFGFVDPPVEIVGRRQRLAFRALSPRGRRLLEIIAPVLADVGAARIVAACPREILLDIVDDGGTVVP